MKFLRVKSKIWLNQREDMLLGEGRVDLLLAIEKYGSINKAAQSMRMSYAKAWKLIDTMNNASEQNLVEKSSGGAGGGGTVLTPYGSRSIVVFQKLNNACQVFLDKELSRLIKEDADANA